MTPCCIFIMSRESTKSTDAMILTCLCNCCIWKCTVIHYANQTHPINNYWKLNFDFPFLSIYRKLILCVTVLLYEFRKFQCSIHFLHLWKLFRAFPLCHYQWPNNNLFRSKDNQLGFSPKHAVNHWIWTTLSCAIIRKGPQMMICVSLNPLLECFIYFWNNCTIVWKWKIHRSLHKHQLAHLIFLEWTFPILINKCYKLIILRLLNLKK